MAISMKDLPVGRFFGHAKQRFATAGLVLSEVDHPSAKRLPRHGHQNSFLTIVLDGHYTEHFANETVEFRPGWMSLHQACIEHEDQIEPGGSTMLCAEMAPSWIEGCFGETTFTNDVYGPVPSEHLIHRLRSVLGMSGLEGMAEELIIEVVDFASQGRGFTQGPAPDVFQRARDMLHGCYADNLTVRDVASELGTHPVYLSRIFRNKTGKTLGEYLNRIRVEAAARLVMTSDEPLSEIALASGFFDQSHFTRVFKQATGFTPGKWRENARRGREN
jgi:AraC family transcriptional regulator